MNVFQHELKSNPRHTQEKLIKKSTFHRKMVAEAQFLYRQCNVKYDQFQQGSTAIIPAREIFIMHLNLCTLTCCIIIILCGKYGAELPVKSDL